MDELLDNCMKFKQCLEFDSGLATAANGSDQLFPGSNLNDKLPVQSRISCKDGSDKITRDPISHIPPGKLFGFRTPTDKKVTDKTSSQYINTNSRRAAITTIPPDNT